MSNELQRQHEDITTTRQILTHLQELYGEQRRIAHFEVSKRLFKVKMRDGQLVHGHCLTMIKNLEELEKLGLSMDKDLQIQCTIYELINMLVIIEGTLKSSMGFVFAVEHTSSKRKSTGKKKSVKKQKVESKKKEVPKKKAIEKEKYFHCDKNGD
uniref:Uncharacterized protein LOC105041490 n=1 Tax=Elaeis guineensis var. tenera TaxID=51953 RepID=A0A6I9QX98_ELAGV|nr:uncharacterized protein LOC105041490 [Elaeis guineensis]